MFHVCVYEHVCVTKIKNQSRSSIWKSHPIPKRSQWWKQVDEIAAAPTYFGHPLLRPRCVMCVHVYVFVRVYVYRDRCTFKTIWKQKRIGRVRYWIASSSRRFGSFFFFFSLIRSFEIPNIFQFTAHLPFTFARLYLRLYSSHNDDSNSPILRNALSWEVLEISSYVSAVNCDFATCFAYNVYRHNSYVIIRNKYFILSLNHFVGQRINH